MSTTTPVQSKPRSKVERDLSAVPINPRGNGWYGVLSSDGSEVYRVRIAPAMRCDCRGFQSHGHCYHTEAVELQYGAEPVQCCAGCGVLYPQSVMVKPAGAFVWRCGNPDRCSRVHQVFTSAYWAVR